MTRTQRIPSSADMYHIIIRGAGQQVIFEDDSDRVLFLRLLGKYLDELHGKVFAWTLMSNHVHLVLHMPLADIATLMRKLGPTYLVNYNKKTARSGHVLQDRFFSEPINTEAYLMTCIRYVHQNAEKAGVCRMEDYEWSSYGDYTGRIAIDMPLRTETGFPLGLFGGRSAFERFHAERNYAVPCIDIGKSTSRMSDDEALVYASSLLGEGVLQHLKELEPSKRNALIAKFAGSAITSCQIARLTGIGDRTIRRVLEKTRSSSSV